MIDWLLLAAVMTVIAILIYDAEIPSLGRMIRNAFVIMSIVPSRLTRHGIKIRLYHWRLVEMMKGGDGILLLDWSTTYLVTVVDCRRR